MRGLSLTVHPPCAKPPLVSSSGPPGALVRDLQAKFNFTWRSEREHAGPYANAIRIVCQRVRPIDCTGGAGKQAGHNAPDAAQVFVSSVLSMQKLRKKTDKGWS
jgi:hypothetical protein